MTWQKQTDMICAISKVSMDMCSGGSNLRYWYSFVHEDMLIAF